MKNQRNELFEEKSIPEYLLKRPLVSIALIIVMLFCSIMLIRNIFSFSFDMIYSILGFVNLWLTFRLIRKYLKAKNEYDKNQINN